MKRTTVKIVTYMYLILIITSCSNINDPVTIEINMQKKAIINVNLVPMTGEQIIGDQTVLVDGNYIVEIGPSSEIEIPEEATIIEGAGAYLMPGLADMHVHTRIDWMDSRWPVSPLNLYIANGVTTIRDYGPTGSDITYVFQWKDRINSGTLAGPALYTSGLQLRSDNGQTLNPQEIVQWNFTRGFDFLKIYDTVSSAGFQDAMAAVRQTGMYTAGHIPFPVGLERVIAEGYDEIAHIEELDWEFVEFNRDTVLTWGDWLPYLIGSVIQQNDISSGFDLGKFQAKYSDRLTSLINILKSNNIPLCTTLIVDDLLVEKLFESGIFLSRPEIRYMPQDYLSDFNQGVGKHQLQFNGIEDLATFKYEMDKMLLDELHRVGVKLLLSTDSGSATMGIVPGFSIHDELEILIENGFTPFEAIEMGTVNASKVIEMMTGSNDFGTIEIGKRADFILINDNPLDDVSNIKDILAVMAAGIWYSKEILDRMIQ